MSLTVLLAVAFVGAALYYVCPLRLRWVLLLLLSYGFYLTCGLSALPFIALTTLTTWAGALVIARVGESGKAYLREHKAELTAEAKKAQKARTRSRQRVWFFAVLLLNFGVLAVLKYLNPVMAWGASLLGGSAPSLGLVLPLGISFYTFQSMGYLIDVYNGKYAPEKNPAKFALFVSFFPQLIQGPIARFDQLESQLVTPHRFDLDGIERGLLLMLWGWFKKKVIADRALPPVEAVFGSQSAYGGAVIVVGVLFYSLQQYADFSGGIDMVLGVAQLYGIEMMPNFRQPYFSTSLGDFWRRWHISLGAWMRDYLFYPFALTKPMQRFGKWATSHWGKHFGRVLPAAVANLLVFAVVGIWHGPQAHYLAWGLYNGLVIALADLLEPAFKKLNTALHIPTESRGWHVFRIVRTFIIVNIGWYFDRNEFVQGCIYLRNTFTDFNLSALAANAPGAFAAVSGPAWGLVIISTLLVFAHSVLKEQGRDPYAEVQRLPLALRWGLYYLVIFMVLLSFICVNETVGFLYANF